jgi:hypothetical protein
MTAQAFVDAAKEIMKREDTKQRNGFFKKKPSRR